MKCHQIQALKSKSNKIVAGEHWGTVLTAFGEYYSVEDGISEEMDAVHRGKYWMCISNLLSEYMTNSEFHF